MVTKDVLAPEHRESFEWAVALQPERAKAALQAHLQGSSTAPWVELARAFSERINGIDPADFAGVSPPSRPDPPIALIVTASHLGHAPSVSRRLRTLARYCAACGSVIVVPSRAYAAAAAYARTVA